MLPCNYESVFIRYLRQLKQLLVTIEQYDSNEKNLLNCRLAPNMFSLSTQLRITSNFSIRTCCHLRGEPPVSYDDFPATYQGLTSQINSTIKHIQQLPDNPQLVKSVNSDKAGFSELSLPANEYLFQFAMPNFFFHLSTVYAIARQEGVPLSKGDFDGYHGYPEGFSFEE